VGAGAIRTRGASEGRARGGAGDGVSASTRVEADDP